MSVSEKMYPAPNSVLFHIFHHVQHVSDSEGNERVMITSRTAMRDPKVWGADADEFKLRDLTLYEELSVAWIEQAVCEAQPEHNLSSSGKHLSLAMITGMK